MKGKGNAKIVPVCVHLMMKKANALFCSIDPLCIHQKGEGEQKNLVL